MDGDADEHGPDTPVVVYDSDNNQEYTFDEIDVEFNDDTDPAITIGI